MAEPVWAVGLMSGTSLDGLDAALLRTDGEAVVERGPWLSLPFTESLRQALHQAVRQEGDIPSIEREFTLHNVTLVEQLLEKADLQPADVSLIGFHGQTILHRPEAQKTWQIGDAALLAERTGIDVVADFRSADMRAGGQGAPLVPLYHAALVQDMELPLAILNIGGIANVTWVGEVLCAFDTGPGNVLLNEWVLQHTGQACDEGGKLAQVGVVNDAVLGQLLAHPFFALPPPKSLDRHDFTLGALSGLSPEDGAATLTAFTAEAVKQAQQHFLPFLINQLSFHLKLGFFYVALLKNLFGF